METEDEMTPDEPISIRKLLEPFFSANKGAEGIEQNNVLLIGRPWNDKSLKLHVTQDADLIAALNSVYLPPMLYGIWHRVSKDIEFVYTPLSKDGELVKRSFEMFYDGRMIQCEWAKPSKALIQLAFASRPVETEISDTNYRNLLEFQRGMIYRVNRKDSLPAEIGPPLSFWIRNIDWDADKVRRLCQHVNFYMRYYDRETPFILLTEETPEPHEVTLPRYPYGTFPPKLTGFSSNSHMLDLWSITTETFDPFRRFLHSYQILEYFAHYYISAKIKDEVRKLMVRPDAVSHIEEVTTQVIDALTPGLQDDKAKLEGMLRECVEPSAVWQVIEPYRSYFDKPIAFDGGFIQDALINKEDQLTDFVKNWPAKFVAKLEALRNHVAHSRERRHTTNVAPTLSAQERLVPWAAVVLRAAEEVMIYQK